MNEQIYTNYRLQLPDQELLGTVVVRDGQIADIQSGSVAIGQNGEGDILMPGLIELHTDNLERCMSPRPKIQWPLEAAAAYHDRDLASAGITTVCDAIAIGDIQGGSTRMTHYGPMIDVIHEGQTRGNYAIDHRIHLRCELTYPLVCEVVEGYAEHPLLTLISLMDHTPGQRQYIDVEKFRHYYMGKHGLTLQQVEQFIQDCVGQQQRYGIPNRAALVDLAQTRRITLASHDDTTVEHVQEAIQNGAEIAEFPTTLEAAREAHTSGLKVLMGAPNVVLGGSHSGNVSALDLVKQKVVDILSSDYVPQSLLQSVFAIVEKTGQPLYEAMRLVTANPAKAIQLFQDRGSLEIGKRADLIMIRSEGGIPRLQGVLSQGQRVA